jgi:hypothetical protein
MEAFELTAANAGAMSSVVSFISNAVFEPADIKLMSDAYNKAIEDVYGFGHPQQDRWKDHCGADYNTYKGRRARPQSIV